MQILNADEIRAWDQYTIQHEPVASIDLMERAASRCVEWIESQSWRHRSFKIFCGKGNNGGDGLVIARLLVQKNLPVSVYILESGKPGSEDFQVNLHRLHGLLFEPHILESGHNFPEIHPEDIVIDALFGSGLNQPLKDLAAQLVQHINGADAPVVAIDLPSGLFIDHSSKGNTVIEADHTLTFQCYKLGLLIQENARFIGDVHILDIGLHPDFLKAKAPQYQLVDFSYARTLFKPRNAFAHKGAFGHALLIAGSYGKVGAAVLATRACLHTGAGLTTTYIPKCGYEVLQVAVPEAMVIADESEQHLSTLPNEIEKYEAIGIGPGIGTDDATQKMIAFITKRHHKPLVIDADGLNCLSLQKDMLAQLPSRSILTPHPKEFDRLFGTHETDFDRMRAAKEKATVLNSILVLKSHHTLIATPEGQVFFNASGNAGMAKGGSGDVLTGIITALVAQGYSPQEAAILGVYLHGLAGDLAAEGLSKEAMTATDLITFLSPAFLKFY